MGMTILSSGTCDPADVASHLDQLLAFDTSPDGHDHRAAVAWIRDRLLAMSFGVEIVHSSGPPLVVATRPATPGARGHLFLFGHYDVDHVEPGWNTPPFRLTQRDGRWFGLGIADNKGALAARLRALRGLDACPRLTWIIQGEEESGSGALKAWLAEGGLPSADWYLDENGWADAEGSQRVLACRIAHGQRVPLNEREADNLVELLSVGWSKRHIEPRMLNKHLVPGGCAFQAALPEGARYLGIGTNDAATQIHAPNESISECGVVRHVNGLVAFLGAVARGDV